MLFGERLRALRNEKKFSQTKLSEELGISRQVLGRYEKGTSMPTVAVLADIADYFAVSADFLIGRDEYYVLNCGNKGGNSVLLPKELTEDDYVTVKELVESLRRRRQKRGN